MTTLHRFPLLIACFCVTGSCATAQQTEAEARLGAARALYYTPTAQGLISFRCNMTVSWKDALTSMSGRQTSDTDPMLLHLNATHLTVADDLLTGRQTLNWTNTQPSLEEKEPALKTVRESLGAMLSSYFQSWNPYVNGHIIPRPDKSVTVTEQEGGLAVHALLGYSTGTEVFDKNLLLSEIHAATSEWKTDTFPTYTASPDGLIVHTIQSMVSRPPTAPPVQITYSTSYATVSSYQLPSQVLIERKNVASLSFSLSGCEVTTNKNSPVKP